MELGWWTCWLHHVVVRVEVRMADSNIGSDEEDIAVDDVDEICVVLAQRRLVDGRWKETGSSRIKSRYSIGEKTTPLVYRRIN